MNMEITKIYRKQKTLNIQK